VLKADITPSPELRLENTRVMSPHGQNQALGS
jgi:hypothetical protein